MARATARVPSSATIPASVLSVSAEIGLKRQIAPQLDPDLAADVGADRRLHAGGDHLLGEARRALALLARRLAERDAGAVGVADDAGRLDLGGDIDGGADRPLGPERGGDRPAGIDGLDALAVMRPAEAVEIPPGDAVLHGDDGGVGAEQRQDRRQRRGTEWAFMVRTT